MPPWKGLDFEPTKQGISLFRVARQAAECQKRQKTKKNKAPRGAEEHVFVFSLENKWFRDEGQTAEYTKKKNASKIVRKSPFFHAKFFVGTAENSKKHYALNGFAEKIVFLFLGRVPKKPF